MFCICNLFLVHRMLNNRSILTSFQNMILDLKTINIKNRILILSKHFFIKFCLLKGLSFLKISISLCFVLSKFLNFFNNFKDLTLKVPLGTFFLLSLISYSGGKKLYFFISFFIRSNLFYKSLFSNNSIKSYYGCSFYIKKSIQSLLLPSDKIS